EAFDRVGHVDGAVSFEDLAAAGIQDLVDQARRLLVGQRAILDRSQFAVQTDERWQADGEVDVGAAVLPAELQERVDSRHCGLDPRQAAIGRFFNSPAEAGRVSGSRDMACITTREREPGTSGAASARSGMFPSRCWNRMLTVLSPLNGWRPDNSSY